MYKKSFYISRAVFFTFILIMMPVITQIKVNAAHIPPQVNELSEQAKDRFWKDYNNSRYKESQNSQDKYTQINSTYMVYPSAHKRVDSTQLTMKNKSLSLSFPIQHKRTISNEKKVIKHLDSTAEE